MGPALTEAPSRFQVAITPVQPVVSSTYQQPCLCCDDTVAGSGVSLHCSALQLLSTLEGEME